MIECGDWGSSPPSLRTIEVEGCSEGGETAGWLSAGGCNVRPQEEKRGVLSAARKAVMDVNWNGRNSRGFGAMGAMTINDARTKYWLWANDARTKGWL